VCVDRQKTVFPQFLKENASHFFDDIVWGNWGEEHRDGIFLWGVRTLSKKHTTVAIFTKPQPKKLLRRRIGCESYIIQSPPSELLRIHKDNIHKDKIYQDKIYQDAIQYRTHRGHVDWRIYGQDTL